MIRIVLLLVIISLKINSVFAQKVDIFIGGDLILRDLVEGRMYDPTVNITPGVKWQIGNNWNFSAEAIVPIYSTYVGNNSTVRLSVANISKELKLGEKNFVKLSGGLFSDERYGLDIKWFRPLSNIFALEAQVGYTGEHIWHSNIEITSPNQLTALFGVNAYIEPHKTAIRVRGGRFMYNDIGVIGECTRHFTHCSVGVYAQSSNHHLDTFSAGFSITIMLPPYKRQKRDVRVRPKSNFLLEYNVNSNYEMARMYKTDPEESVRDGWFNSNMMTWGGYGTHNDFTEK